MATRWGSTALAVALLSLLLLSNNAAADVDAGQELDADAKATEMTEVADPVIRLPSDRSVTVNEGSNPVEAESVPVFRSEGLDHQESGGGSSTAETTTMEAADPADAIPSLKVSLIPIRRHGDGDGNGLHRVHLRGARGFFWFMRPRHHHSRLFHQLFLDGRQPDGALPEMEVHLGGHHRAAQLILRRGIQLPLPMEMEQEQEDQQQQEVPRVLAFRIRRLGPHQHHHGGMMHDCAWRKRLEALGAEANGEHKAEEGTAQEEGFTGLVKRFTVFLNPQRN